MIIHIDTETEWRGGQQQAVYLILGLIEKGIDVTLICRKNSKLHEYAENNNIPYKLFSLKSEGDILSAVRIAVYSKKVKASLIHCHNSHALSIGLMCSMFSGIPVVASRRVDFPIRGNFFSRLKYNNIFLKRLICISDNIYHVVKDGGIPTDKLSVIRSAIDLKKIDSINPNFKIIDETIPNHSLLIGTVAAHTGHKDYPTLINAAKLVLNKHPEVLFVSVGDGKLTDEINRLIKKHDVEDRFILLGYKPNVYDYLNAFDIFVLSSKLEGLGTSVIDALNCGIACVCTNAGGIPEMITNRENGLLVPKKDHYALAKAIMELVEDKELRKKLGKNAKKSVHDFDISVNIDKHIELYKEIVGEL